jgi:3-polyprenyl-4-hydroxybenzoate decarboxylase
MKFLEPNKNKVVVAVTGGIAAYKAADVISALISKGYEVKVIATDNALNFVTANVLNVISKGNYITETAGETKHIELAKWADAFVVVPATANTIAKMVCGIADNLVLTTFLALHRDTYKFICPAMNTYMWESEQNLLNIKKLSKLGTGSIIINPIEGLLACGDIGMGKLAPTKIIVETVCDKLEDFPKWSFPLDCKNVVGVTNDSYSFLDYDWHHQIEIPIGSHVGAFGVRRRHDIHKGIDLYAKVGEPVFTVEDGRIVEICPFTGEVAGFPWWENTWGIYIEGKSGIVVYGEIRPNSYYKVGDLVHKNSNIGSVLRVLKKDNGRPLSMLHLELHEKNHIHTGQWEIGKPKPTGILDPTKYLLKSI